MEGVALVNRSQVTLSSLIALSVNRADANNVASESLK